MKTKECEVHFNIARYEHQRKLAEAEGVRSRTLSSQVSTFSHTETELRSQLNIYVEKFKQVSLSLDNFLSLSRPLFDSFRYLHFFDTQAVRMYIIKLPLSNSWSTLG